MPNLDDINVTRKKLIEKYIDNTCTKEELRQLLLMMENEKNTEEFTLLLNEYWERSGTANNEQEFDLDAKFAILMQEAKHEAPVFSIKSGNWKNKWKIHYAAAAIIICMLSIGSYFLFNSVESKQISKIENPIQNKKDIAPGGNAAILTLSDGSIVILDKAQNGTVSTQGNTKVLKLSNGMISYNILNNKKSEMLFNTVSTPRGGLYLLILSDGSKVWLNAASSLKFPVNFIGKERKVELLGEAYFEVAKNATMPFKVKVDGMEVEVLGTHFNINSYDDESLVRTTLLEGSVKIKRNNITNLLKPGQEAQMDKVGKIKIINDANIEEAVAWKEGNFQFDRDDIHAVMRQISRWYDVDVEYKGVIASHFGGTISRNVNLSQILDMLHLTGKVKFEVKDKRIIVMP
jgi:hypothetical protein